eukprot:CAMPEP_0201685022 /NCGR_PEP_ID=MMETSP0494-20130426/52945_1 /ASSEMBLY_ACC=CAM_ASM_000839 /TAXON_ID=420259 /ORGANISM="Thalassiosira gravida, Strain GMp14c1" /LENGTH=152 /DNA_ID=CAMNT_0048168849 /DNA_START=106 /DNA_END=564 /DNA_ORIENTATION=-
MSYCKSSAVVEASPETIWETCFAPMRWESWDHNLLQLKNTSGPCQNGTTTTFLRKNGATNFHFTLSNVTPHRTLNFSGVALGNTIKAEGKIVILPIDNVYTKIDYSFELSGSVGFVVAIMRKGDVVEGTEDGLKNMVRLAEEAQEREIVNMN